MAQLEPLGRMSPEKYKELAQDPRNLMKYNAEMPQHNYENPYTYQSLPRYVFKTVVRDGRLYLQQAFVTTPERESELLADGWVFSPSLCTPPYETCPGAPEIAVSEFENVMSVPAPEVDEPIQQEPEPEKKKRVAAG